MRECVYAWQRLPKRTRHSLLRSPLRSPFPAQTHAGIDTAARRHAHRACTQRHSTTQLTVGFAHSSGDASSNTFACRQRVPRSPMRPTCSCCVLSVVNTNAQLQMAWSALAVLLPVLALLAASGVDARASRGNVGTQGTVYVLDMSSTYSLPRADFYETAHLIAALQGIVNRCASADAH